MSSADPLDEVVLSASSTEGSVQAWCVALALRRPARAALTAQCRDLDTFTLLASYKNNASARGCLCRLGPSHFLAGACRAGRARQRVRSRASAAAAQNSKGALHAWTWGREQPALRCFAAEPLCALAASEDGALAVGGTASGTLLLWQTGSGKLLRTWPAHHKAVSALAFAPDGSWLASGGDDTTVCVWSLAGALRVLRVHVCRALR